MRSVAERLLDQASRERRNDRAVAALAVFADRLRAAALTRDEGVCLPFEDERRAGPAFDLNERTLGALRLYVETGSMGDAPEDLPAALLEPKALVNATLGQFEVPADMDKDTALKVRPPPLPPTRAACDAYYASCSPP